MNRCDDTVDNNALKNYVYFMMFCLLNATSAFILIDQF